MRRGVAWAWILAGALAAFTAAPVIYAQADGAPAAGSGQSGQKQPAQQPGQSPKSSQGPQSGQNAQPQNGNVQKPAAQGSGNPFPEDENSVPLMPSSNAPDLSAGANGEGHAAAPTEDKDPVRSPDDAGPGGDDSTQGFSSSQAGLGNLTGPPPGADQGKHRKGDDSALDTFPRETPQNDVNVGNYYLDIKDWRGALSRFQSALVLAPDNPDVYWGLAECERHLGQFAEARANYLKVMEYDPGSHHAKDAKKALRDPEIANAKPAGGQAQK